MSILSPTRFLLQYMYKLLMYVILFVVCIHRKGRNIFFYPLFSRRTYTTHDFLSMVFVPTLNNLTARCRPLSLLSLNVQNKLRRTKISLRLSLNNYHFAKQILSWAPALDKKNWQNVVFQLDQNTEVFSNELEYRKYNLISRQISSHAGGKK